MPNNRFPLLSFVSVLIRIVGALLCLGATFYGVKEGVLEPMEPRHHFGGEDMLQLTSGLVGLLLGLFAIAGGEAIGVLLAIESNTRASRSDAGVAEAI